MPRLPTSSTQAERGAPAFPGAAVPAPSGLVKAGDRAADLVAFEDSVVSYFVDAAHLLGVPKSVAAIYGICFASPEPLSFSEINERLVISAGSISQGLKVLREIGALKVAGATGKLKNRHAEMPKGKASANADDTPRGLEGSDSEEADNDPTGHAGSISAFRHVGVSAFQRGSAARYEPDLELRRLVQRWIEQRLQTQLASGHNRLQGIMNTIPAGSRDVLQERVFALQNWNDKARALMPLAKGFLKLG